MLKYLVLLGLVINAFVVHDNEGILITPGYTLMLFKGATTPFGDDHLKCIGGNGCNTCKDPSLVHCVKSIGAGWDCSADMVDGMLLNATIVKCRLFRTNNQIYVLKGSCVLEYRLGGGASYNPNTDNGFVVVVGTILLIGMAIACTTYNNSFASETRPIVVKDDAEEEDEADAKAKVVNNKWEYAEKDEVGKKIKDFIWTQFKKTMDDSPSTVQPIFIDTVVVRKNEAGEIIGWTLTGNLNTKA